MKSNRRQFASELIALALLLVLCRNMLLGRADAKASPPDFSKVDPPQGFGDTVASPCEMAAELRFALGLSAADLAWTDMTEKEHTAVLEATISYCELHANELAPLLSSYDELRDAAFRAYELDPGDFMKAGTDFTEQQAIAAQDAGCQSAEASLLGAIALIENAAAGLLVTVDEQLSQSVQSDVAARRAFPLLEARFAALGLTELEASQIKPLQRERDLVIINHHRRTQLPLVRRAVLTYDESAAAVLDSEGQATLELRSAANDARQESFEAAETVLCGEPD